MSTAGMPDTHVINIQGERVALGPLHRGIIPCYFRWVNDFEIMRTFGPPAPVTQEQADAWYEALLHRSGTQRFVIYERSAPQPIGYASLVDIDFRNRRAEYEIMIGDRRCHGKGYGTEVTSLMLYYAFDWLGLHSVMLEVSSNNPAGLRAYQRAGFREIGRRREAYLMDGDWCDKIYMDILSTEFERPVSSKIQTGEEQFPQT